MSENTENIIANEIQETSDLPKEVNNDELILAQEKQIEREIADKIPLIGNRIGISVLTNEYSTEDHIYQQKIADLQQNYGYIRKTRPDGNCFFRAFTFAFFENLITDRQELDRFIPIGRQSLDRLVEQGFPQFTIEDFYEQFIDVLTKISDGIKSEELVQSFNDSSLSDYLVVYIRLITSGHLQRESEFFSNFIEGHRTVAEFCKQEVEPMYKESDHIHIIALTAEFKVPVRIVYMDRGEGGRVNTHDFGSEDGAEKAPKLHLLYRPGHYDILYPKD